jgi:hypothetical protein
MNDIHLRLSDALLNFYHIAVRNLIFRISDCYANKEIEHTDPLRR